MDTKDILNKYRIFPRIFAGFYLYYMSKVLEWAMALPDPSQAEWLVMGVVAAAAAFFKFYVESGHGNKD